MSGNSGVPTRCWKLFSAVLGLLNVAGYYDTLLAFLRASVEQQFMHERQVELLQTDSDPLQLLPQLVQAAGISAAPRLESI